MIAKCPRHKDVGNTQDIPNDRMIHGNPRGPIVSTISVVPSHFCSQSRPLNLIISVVTGMQQQFQPSTSFPFQNVVQFFSVKRKIRNCWCSVCMVFWSSPLLLGHALPWRPCFHRFGLALHNDSASITNSCLGTTVSLAAFKAALVVLSHCIQSQSQDFSALELGVAEAAGGWSVWSSTREECTGAGGHGVSNSD